MKREIKILIFLFFILVYKSAGQEENAGISDTLLFKGQLSTWVHVNGSNGLPFWVGGRYIPQINYTLTTPKNRLIDFEASANVFGIYGLQPLDTSFSDGDIKPYRLWCRYSTNQFELRVGLQKINFGSASMLRPLMWFDQLDPRDPLQLTDGVYGLLARYYFLNNANLWSWVLYGNKNTKGWEYVPSNKKRPEFGGRFQYPALSGELAFSYHNRELDYSQTKLDSISQRFGKIPENKMGLDGKWDVGIGLWFEGVIQHQDIQQKYYPWQKHVNLGLDYTFSLGKGLYAINEFLWISTSENILTTNKELSFSILALNYPIGVLDNVMGIVYYDWTNNDWYRFVNWQRTYDRINLYLMLFWNPDEFTIYQSIEETSLFSGAGIQFMFVFYH